MMDVLFLEIFTHCDAAGPCTEQHRTSNLIAETIGASINH